MALTEKYGSKKEFKTAFKSSSGTSSGMFRRFKDGESCRIRFLQEMEDWEKGYTHWMKDSAGKSVFRWCSRRDDCPGCESGDSPRQIWLANGVVREDGKVQIIQVPGGIAKQLFRKYESSGTICDRDYIISRTGATLNDTEYFLDWEDRSRFNADRYQVVDIPKAIMQELGLDADEVEDDDEEETPRRPKKSKPSVRKPSRSRDDDDDMDDEDEEDEPPRKPVIKKKSGTIKASTTTRRVVRRS